MQVDYQLLSELVRHQKPLLRNLIERDDASVEVARKRLFQTPAPDRAPANTDAPRQPAPPPALHQSPLVAGSPGLTPEQARGEELAGVEGLGAFPDFDDLDADGLEAALFGPEELVAPPALAEVERPGAVQVGQMAAAATTAAGEHGDQAEAEEPEGVGKAAEIEAAQGAAAAPVDRPRRAIGPSPIT